MEKQATRQTLQSLKMDLGLEQGELSFHKKHVHSTKQDEIKCKQNIKQLKQKIRKTINQLEIAN